MTLLDGKPLEAQEAPSRALWDALLNACGVDSQQVTRSARGAYNRCVGDLVKMHASVEDVLDHAQMFRLRWPDVSLTPTALVRRWAETVPPKRVEQPKRRVGSTCSRCDHGWIEQADGTVARCQH